MSRRRVLIAIWTLPSVVLLAITAVVYATYRIPPPDRLDAAGRIAVIAPLRVALDATTVTPAPASTDRPLRLVATVWSAGRALTRIEGRGDALAAATADAAARLAADRAVAALSSAARAAARIQVDVLAGRAPLATAGSLVSAVAVPELVELLAVQPGVDGIGTTVDGRDVVLLPDELVDANVLAAKQPSATVAEVAIGVDLPRIVAMLSQRAGGRVPAAGLFRFRTDAFVEPPADARDRTPLPLTRGVPPRPPVTAQALRDAALAGGRYLVDHLSATGRFTYEHDLATGRDTDPNNPSSPYAMPRHAGTTYFLAELYRITHAAWLREPIERALGQLIERVDRSGCGGTTADGTRFDCVLDRNERQAQLGSTALGVVALVEYQRATGDARYLERTRRLAAFLLYMQRADGSFRHLYDPARHAPDDAAQLLYYSGEAALALARMYALTGDSRYADAAARGVDWLVDWYDFFLGGFIYGEEHWTCIAADALADYPPRADAYRAFCDGYAVFLRDQQAHVGDLPDEDDLAGAYDVSAFVPPYNFSAGSRTEAMVSTYLLDQRAGEPDPATRDQIVAALGYLLGQQVRADSDFDAVGASDGAIPGSPIDRTVRIDYVQHVCSAMIRAAEALDLPLHSDADPYVPQDDKKTQIGTGTQNPNRPITGAPQNVTDAGTAAKTEFLDPASVPPANSTPPPQTPPPGLPPPAIGTAPAVTAGYIAQLQAQQQQDTLLGQTIGGRYYIQKKLGEGGMGAVYLATHTIIEKQVALKILHGEFARKGDLVERFMQEAKAASKIQHENVIDVSDFGITNDGLVFFAMELLNGHDLHDEVARARIAGQLLPWSRTKKIFLQICAALAAAHRRGIVHRDLKPENVFLVDFLGDADFVKLLDFGIAKMTEVGEDGRKLTRTGMLFGTPEYMSPEQARGETADHRVDIYAMGCILFQLITTRVPFEAENFMGVLSLHLTEAPPAIPDEVFDRIGAPRALAQIIDKALEKQRDNRYQSIDDMANAVRVACGDPPVSRTTEITRAASVAAPANVTTQRPAITPPPGGVAYGTAPPPGSAPPVNATASATPAPAAKTQWTGQLVVPTEGGAPAPSRSKAPLLIGAGIVVAGGAIAAALVLKGGGSGGSGGSGGTGSGSNPAVVTVGSGSGSAVVAVVADAAVPTAPALPTEVLLTIEANVKGAEIYDFDRKAPVGRAPMTFPVVPGHELRHFTVRAPGYVEALVEVVPEKHELKQVVTLQRGVGTVNQLPRVDAGVAPPGVDASVVTVPIDAAITAVVPADAPAVTKPPDDDCDMPPCIKSFPGSNK